MFYSGTALGNLIKSNSEEESNLVPNGGLTPSYQSMCESLGEAIAECHNAFQQSCSINGVTVFGGLCSPNGGSLSSGIGIASPGSISGVVSNVGSTCISKFPSSGMNSLTPSLRSYVSAVGGGFQNVYNQFLATSSLFGIEVNGGSCSCQVISGAPIPGSFSGGVGKLSSLSSGVAGVPITATQLFSTMLGLMDSNILATGSPTESLRASLRALCSAIEEYHQDWMTNTKITDLQVSGGLTIPYGPISGGLGFGGMLA